MIVTAIVDPTALAKDLLKDEAYRLQVEQFLKGIKKNGFLVTDSEEKLIAQMKTMIEHSNINTLFYETVLSPNNAPRIIHYKVPIPATPDQDIKNVCVKLDGCRSPDVIIASPGNLQDFRNSVTGGCQVITFKDYSSSEFEKKRDGYLIVKPLHKLEFSECEDLFTRVVGSASEIRIYDKQIGVKGGNVAGFRRGIGFILRLWKKADYYCNKTVNVKIFIVRDDSAYQIETVCKDLINKLKKELKLPLELFIMPKRQQHARYLETESTVLLMERGFDFMRNDREIKPTEISLKPESREYLRTLRVDKECVEVSCSSGGGQPVQT